MAVGPGSDNGAGLMSRRARQGQNLRLSGRIECEKLLSCVSDGVAEWTCILFIIFIFVYFLIVGFTESLLQCMGSSLPCTGFP